MCSTAQARYAEDLLLCWDSLHRVIFEAGGLWSNDAYLRHRKVTKHRMPLDLKAHERRNDGATWDQDSTLLDWLGISLHVSQMRHGGGRALLEQDNSLEGIDNSIHSWLTHHERLQAGRAPLSQQVVKLVARYEAERGPNAPAPRVCVSMCGSPKMAQNVS